MLNVTHTKISQIKTIMVDHFLEGKKTLDLQKLKMFDKTFALVKVIGA